MPIILKKAGFICAAVFSVLLLACGGGSSQVANAGAGLGASFNSVVALTVTPSLGKISNADVVLKRPDGTVLNTVNTGTLGTATFSNVPGNSPLLIEVKGTTNSTYYDEAVNSTQAFANTLNLRGAILTPATGVINVGVTPLTEAAVARLIGLGLSLTAPNITNVNSAVANAFSMPDILLPPALVGSSGDLSALSNTLAGQYALKLAALAQVAHAKNGALSNPAAAVLPAFSQDLADGKLDSKNGSNVITTPYTAATFAADWESAASTIASANANSSFSSFVVSSNFAPITTLLVEAGAPVLTVPANITMAAAAGATGRNVFFTVTAVDSDNHTLTPVCTPQSGALFAIGSTMVGCTATDAADKKGTAGFSVTVSDSTPPVIAAHANVTAEAAGPSGSAVSFSVPSANDDISGVLTSTCVPASGSIFPIGTTAVVCSAADSAGNSVSTGFNVTVADTAGPVIAVPANMAVAATSAGGSTVSYTVTASDAVSGPVNASCTPASGTLFPPGTTVVSCTAADALSNTRTASFSVTVVDGLMITPAPAGGSYSGIQYVKLNTSRPGAIIYYTTDNSTPTVNSKVYNSPIIIPANSNITLKFFGQDQLGTSALAAASYATGNVITNVAIQSSGSASQTNVPITFGQAFAPGDVPAGNTLAGTLSNGSAVSLQVDAKATHADGSLRHAVISAVIPSLATGQTETIALTKTPGATIPSIVSPTVLTAAGFTASVNINLGGVAYTASADSLLKGVLCATCTWLSGPAVQEWLVSTPFKDSSGNAHPHLTARFAIRSYAGLNKARVDVTVENDWAYEPAPQDFTYTANIVVGGNTVYPNTTLKHYHHARWRKMFWWGVAPQADVKHDTAYLLASKAVPNYDSSIVVSGTGLTALVNQWNAASSLYNKSGDGTYTDGNLRTGPLGSGIVTVYMPTTGGRPDIGPLPQWAVMYLLSMDSRAKMVTLGVGDLAGSWPIHFRDKTTDLPINIIAHPYASLSCGNGGSSCIDSSSVSWNTPVCATGGDCATPFTPETAHEPTLAYLPYLVTGDYYYLEELQFWASYNAFSYAPGYRGFGLGYVNSDQTRGQAWGMRTLGQVAYITPDSGAGSGLKSYFNTLVVNNLNYYYNTYVAVPSNSLGIIDGSGINTSLGIRPFNPYFSYGSPYNLVATWQDDFFTWSIGYLAELGFANAPAILAWKAQSPIGRMTAPGYCYVDGAPYNLAIRNDSSVTSQPMYTTFAAAYAATFPARVGVNGDTYGSYACLSSGQTTWNTQNSGDGTFLTGQMTGHSAAPDGYPSNMQPALAVAALSGAPNAQAAWNVFNGRARKPDYSASPQWAVVPRN
ncbi:MAG: HYR domain-containing protein [Pseudomonadota bacterium]